MTHSILGVPDLCFEVCEWVGIDERRADEG